MTKHQEAIILFTLVVFSAISSLIACYFIEPSKTAFISEYELQLIDQNKVVIHSISSNKYITTTPDSIVYYLELDNL